MAHNTLAVTGVERTFADDQIIVSKSDLKGQITYANDVLMSISGYTEKELLGQPHSILRHPEMPRTVFKLLWDFIQSGNEVFAYIINRCKNGDHYWVYAHVTPSKDNAGDIIGYHSNRRVPDRKVLEENIMPLYKQILEAENKSSNRKDGMNAGADIMSSLLQSKGVQYDEFILTIGQNMRRGYR